MNHKYAWIFEKPVDPEADNVPDYLKVIKRPMDFGTIKLKLLELKYDKF